MNKFILVHGSRAKGEILVKKEKNVDVIEREKETDIDTGDAVYHVTEKPHEIFAKLEEPDAIITTDPLWGRVLK